MTAPSVSVIIPVYNGARHLAAAVATIEAQGVDRVEIIVVDDGSTDETDLLVRQLVGEGRIRATRTANRGPAAARNTGIGMASAAIVGFLDVDDEWPLGRLAWMLGRLLGNPVLEAVVGQTQIFAEDAESEAAWAAIQLPTTPVFFPHLAAGLFRRSLFDRIGLFAEELRFGEDVDWYFRVLEEQPAIESVCEVVLLYRLHRENMTTNRVAVRKGMGTAIARSLIRRKRKSDPPAAVPLLHHFMVDWRPGT